MTAATLPHRSRAFRPGAAAALPFSVAAAVVLGLALTALPEAARTVALLTPLLLAAVIDVRTRRIPNLLTAPALALALASAGPSGLPSSATGALAAGAAGLAIATAARGAFGMGDVKLMAYAGAAVGVGALPVFLLAMSLVGGAYAAVGLLSGFARRRGALPYGPAIACGCALILLGWWPR